LEGGALKTNKDKSQQKSKRIAVLLVILSVSTSLFAEKGFRLLTTISGEKSGDQFCTVKNVGDVNGDGFNDLLVGAAEASYTKLYYGGSDFDTIADLTMRVPKHYDYFGQTLAAGDLNNDGFSDFAIGAPYYDEYNHCGKIFVYFGGTNIDSTADMEIEGYGYWHLMGSRIVCDIDVNGDGYQDLLTCSGQYPRKTYIYFGGTNMDIVPDICLSGKDSIICNVEGPSGIGDINNDGYDDFFVSVRADVGLPNYLPGTGQYLIYGGENINLENSVIFKNDSTLGWRRNTQGIGDINNDEYNDFFISYDNADYSNTDRILFYSGYNLDVIDSINMIADIYSSNGGFDIDYDGYNDFMCGFSKPESEYIGDLFIYLGGSDFYNINPSYILQGENSFDYFGISCSFLGDINNDGLPEIAIGKRSGNGKVYIYSFGDFQDRIDDRYGVKSDEFTVLKAYPNPFNNSTVIEYCLKAKSQVRIDIYDLSGQKVITLSNEVRQPGINRVVFNSHNYVSGIYICRITINDIQEETMKILLLK